MGTIRTSSRISSSSVASSLWRARAIEFTTPCTISSAIDDETPGTVADLATVSAKPVGATDEPAVKSAEAAAG